MNCPNGSQQKRNLNRYIAFSIFALSFALYALTAQESVSFWDCAEYAATAPALEVPHPPGAPLFVLLGRFAIMGTFVNDPAFRINLVSSLASALAVMLLYLIGVKVISRWEGFPTDTREAVLVFGSAGIGALTLAVSDTFWFNAAESCLFASAMFFIALMIWLALVWYEKWEEPGASRYLLLVAYVLGLSCGIHQLCLLAFFPLAAIIFFRYFEFEWKRFLKFLVVTGAAFAVIYPGIVRWIVSALSGNLSIGPIDIENSSLVKLTPILGVIGAIYFTRLAVRRKNLLVSSALTAALMVVLGYSTYALVVVRANAFPPINENSPVNMARLSSYIGRDQYGKQPAIWPRRWSSEPQYQKSYEKYSSDLDYFWNYQLGHMFFRYIGFNFIGRQGDAQDSSVELLGNRGRSESENYGYPASYYGIPFLLGLFGLWYIFEQDWKFGLVFLTMFVMMGFALAVYFNMAEPQPRERDYFFVGAFFVYALWIGIGASGLLKSSIQKFGWVTRKTGVTVLLTGLVLTAGPLNMFRENLFSHDRHGNFSALDVSYDILQSCPPNTILFTGGDNDTFPLWYLQEALGVRTDVRVVCLSLSNTGWYLLQLKHETPQVPIGLSDPQIEEIANAGAIQWESKKIRMAVLADVYRKFGIEDSSASYKSYIEYTLQPTLQFGDIHALRVQDIMVNNIVSTNKWNRPVCFTTLTPPSDFIGLQGYFRRIGLVYEVTPVPDNGSYYDAMDVSLMRKCLFSDNANIVDGQKFGFIYEGLNISGVYYDSNARNTISAIRDSFLTLAIYYQAHGDLTNSLSVLNEMEKRIPLAAIPMDYRLTEYISRLYFALGDKSHFREYADSAERGALAAIDYSQSGNEDAYGVLLNIYTMEVDYSKSLALLKKLQSMYPGDPGIASRISVLESQVSKSKDSVGNR